MGKVFISHHMSHNWNVIEKRWIVQLVVSKHREFICLLNYLFYLKTWSENCMSGIWIQPVSSYIFKVIASKTNTNLSVKFPDSVSFFSRSTDYGTTYTKLNLSPGTNIVLTSFYISPTNKKKVGLMHSRLSLFLEIFSDPCWYIEWVWVDTSYTALNWQLFLPIDQTSLRQFFFF